MEPTTLSSSHFSRASRQTSSRNRTTSTWTHSTWARPHDISYYSSPYPTTAFTRFPSQFYPQNASALRHSRFVPLHSKKFTSMDLQQPKQPHTLYNPTRKTKEVCKHFSKGYCRLEKACKFSHEVQKSEVQKSDELCRNYINSSCQLGSSCGFSHEGEGNLKSLQPSNYWLYKTVLCRHFKNGHCRLGTKCCFAHGVAELKSPQKPRIYKKILCNKPVEKCSYGTRYQLKHSNETEKN